MAELVIGAGYPARRNGQIAVRMNPETKSLMAYIPFALIGVDFQGVHSICIGTKDGNLQEVALQNLRDIFGWNTENPFDLQRLPAPESQEAEFELSDWHNEPYTPKGKSEAVDKFCFRWLNRLSVGSKPSTDDEESEALAVWGKKFSAALSTPKAEKRNGPKPHDTSKPEEKSAGRKVPSRKAAEPRKSSAEEVMELLCKKHGVAEDDEEKKQELGDKYFFPAQDELFGKNVSAETPEQWGAVADKLGL